MDFVRTHDGVELAGKVMDNYIADSILCLDVLEESPCKQYLKDLAFFVGDRTV